jgi:hypothetical protein
MAEQGITDDKMKPLLSQSMSKSNGCSLIGTKRAPRMIQTLFLNPAKEVVIKDLQGEKPNYEDLVNHTCHFHLYIHIQSLFQNKAGVWNLIFKASQITLVPSPVVEEVVPLVNEEAVAVAVPEDVEECNDPSLLL